MIEVKNLKYHYRGGRQQVFNGLNLTLGEGQICGLLGKNGAGKSTLLYLMSGLLIPQDGQIQIDGHEMKCRTPELLQDIYIVPEEFNLPNMSFRELVRMMTCFYPRFSEQLLRQCLDRFEMPSEPDLKQLSMGQKKKVYMSFALATGTKILLMDEPTNGLDIPSKELFRQVIAGAMEESRTLVISTHQVHDVETLLDAVVIIDNGRVLFNHSMSEIADTYSFNYLKSQQQAADVLYSEPTLQGNATVSFRKDGPETAVNLELLFNAVTLGKVRN